MVRILNGILEKKGGLLSVDAKDLEYRLYELQAELRFREAILRVVEFDIQHLKWYNYWFKYLFYKRELVKARDAVKHAKLDIAMCQHA